MDVFSNAREFAEDLLMYLTRKCNVPWKPQRFGYSYREEFQSEFYKWIGDAVIYFYGNLQRSPDTLPSTSYLSLRGAHDFIYSRLFKGGNDFFNVLDYCGQLFNFAKHFHEQGDKSALDNCAVFIAATIANLMNNCEISEADYWNELMVTANKITKPIPGPVYQTSVLRLNILDENSQSYCMNDISLVAH